jgi:NACHT domain
LLIHAESRAFLLAYDRTIEDFYIHARFHPSGNLVELLLSGSIEVNDLVITFVVDDTYLKETSPKGEDLLSLLSAVSYCAVRGQRVSSDSVFQILQEVLSGNKIQVKTTLRRFLATNSRKPSAPQLVQVEVTATINLNAFADRLKQEIQASEISLPPILHTTSADISKHVSLLESSEKFLNLTKILHCVTERRFATTTERASIAIASERLVLDIAKVLGIFGGPGSGKTTFLRRLAASLLREGRQVLFVDCAKLRTEHKSLSPGRVVKDTVPKSTPRSWKLSDSVVLVDGVDEAPFDVTPLIKKLSCQTQNLLFSARTVHQVDLSGLAPSLEISPFSTNDRDKFFKTWFAGKPDEFETVSGLIKKNQDIDEHTRIPLLATLIAALVENGYRPESKAQIYDERLTSVAG